MLVKSNADFETPTHSLVKGEIYDLPIKLATALIDTGVCKKLSKKELEKYHGNK